MALTSEQRAVLQARLTEAQTAYHRLQIGTSARVVVDQNGERVEFTSANSSKLKAYIAELEAQLACKDTRARPMKVWFR